jgi:hypothetical protein
MTRKMTVGRRMESLALEMSPEVKAEVEIFKHQERLKVAFLERQTILQAEIYRISQKFEED